MIKGNGAPKFKAPIEQPFAKVNINEKKTIFLPEPVDPEGDDITIDVYSMSSDQNHWISFNSELNELTLTPTTSIMPGFHFLKVTLSDNKDSTEYKLLIEVEEAIVPEDPEPEDPEPEDPEPEDPKNDLEPTEPE